MTRLLKTPIIGPSAKTVASSWIDMLAGLSGEYILRMPPDFCANAGSPEDRAISNPPVAAHARILHFISVLPDVVRLPGLFLDWTLGNRDRTPLPSARFPWALLQGAGVW
jgi:hypothetical protein